MSYLLIIIILCTIAVYILLNTYVVGNINNHLRSHIEVYFFSLCSVFLVVSIEAFLLAIMHLFAEKWVSLCTIVSTIIACLYCFLRGEKRVFKRHDNLVEIILLGCVILFGIIYLTHDTQYLWGGRDPGIYLVKSINIAKLGKIGISSNEFIDKNYELIKDFIDLEYRGSYSDYINGDSIFPGKITFQFLDYTPSIFAIGYLISGVQGVFKVNAIVGLLSLMSCFYCVTNLFGKKIALASVLFLGFNPAQIWAARITQTELAFQLFWFISLYLFLIGWENKSRVCGILSGVIAGIIGLNRIDAYFLGIAIYACCIYSIFFIKEKKRYFFLLSVSYFLASSISILYSFVFSKYYFVGHFKGAGLNSVIYLNIILFLLCCLFYILYKENIDKRYDIITYFSQSKYKRVMICWILFIVLYGLCFFARSFQTGENADIDFNRRACWELSWYTTIPLLFGIILGYYYILDKLKDEKKYILFLISGTIITAIYMVKPGISPDHIWAARRWVSVSIPFITILSFWGIWNYIDQKFIKKKMKYIVFFSLIGVILIYEVMKSSIFLKTTMMEEIEEQYEVLNNSLDDTEIYYAEMTHYAVILRYVYGKNVIVLRNGNLGEAIEKYIENTDNGIYVIGGESILERILTQNLKYNCIYEGKIEGTWLEEVIGKYPSKLIKTGGIVNLYYITKNHE